MMLHPEEWDRVSKAHPALEPYKPYVDMAMHVAHTLSEDVVNNPKHYNFGKHRMH